MKHRFLTFLLAVALFSAVAGAADITAIHITTTPICCVIAGEWGTNWQASIGVTQPGGASNPWLDPTGALDVASGTYLLFLGWEDRFAYGAVAAGSFQANLTVYYDDSTTRTATFVNNVLTSFSVWTRTSGDPLLVLGSSGITNADRVGEDVWGQYHPDGHADGVFVFSDTGRIDMAGVPEPATEWLAVPFLAVGILLKSGTRRRR